MLQKQLFEQGYELMTDNQFKNMYNLVVNFYRISFQTVFICYLLIGFYRNLTHLTHQFNQ